jgi:molybdopterin molybdotransferase
MITVTEAIQCIRENTARLQPINLSLHNAMGLVLAEDTFAAADVPNFPQSAMDGYAFRFADWQAGNSLRILGEMAAGDNKAMEVGSLQAVRIFTGAPVPDDLDTVVMQEKTAVQDGTLLLLDEQLVQGSNVRRKGEEIKKGSLALKKNTVLSPAAIGFLASVGLANVSVFPKPTVHLIITGKELQQPGKALHYGQVYESNSVMLQTALHQLGVSHCSISFVTDDLAQTTAAIINALQAADLVIVTGGVSVGQYDFVVQAAEKAGVQQLFHKVAQRPGKPLYCGAFGNKLVFGLPGNPSSVLSCFYNFVLVAIEEFTGRKNLLQREKLPLLSSFTKKIQLTQFLKASCTAEGVQPLQAQESFRLSSFAFANCLIVLPEERREFVKGEPVEIIRLPYL